MKRAKRRRTSARVPTFSIWFSKTQCVGSSEMPLMVRCYTFDGTSERAVRSVPILELLRDETHRATT